MTAKISRRIFAATLLVSACPAAFAQDRLDTVIITTPGPERSADELIGKATSLDRDEIVETLSGSLGDTLDREPGVATTFFGAGASRPVLRGLGAERVLVLTNGIGVIDVSAASPDHQVAADGIDAERIEILRGPAALAYGGQAIGGVVNVIDGLIAETNPDDPFQLDGFTAYNSVNEGTELSGRSKFAAGPFVFTVSASQRDFEDYDIPGFTESAAQLALEGETGDAETRGTVENSFVETQSLSGGVSWVRDGAFLGVAVRQQTSLYGLPGHSHEEDPLAAPVEEENPFIDLKQTRIDLRGAIDLDHTMLTRLSGTLAVADYEHTEFEAPGEPGTIYTSDGVEARVELGHRLGSLEGAIGAQYLDKDIGAFGDEAFITPTSTTGFGIFLYETREWDNGAGIEGGLRVDSVELDNQIAGQVDFDLVAGSFGVHRHWDNGWFLGGQLSYTERAPNESELFADGAHLATNQYEIGDATLGKESGLNLEGTLRWSDDRFSAGVNLFATDFSDFVYLTPGQTLSGGVLVTEIDDLPVFQFVRSDAQFVGGELYGEWSITDGLFGAEWLLEAGLDVVSAELDGGANVPFVPPVSLNAGARAEWGAWQLGGHVTLAAEQNNPGAGQLPTDGYTTLDLRAGIHLSDFGIGGDGTQLFIDARNVTDEEVRHASSVLKDVIAAPGRNIRIGVQASF